MRVCRHFLNSIIGREGEASDAAGSFRVSLVLLGVCRRFMDSKGWRGAASDAAGYFRIKIWAMGYGNFIMTSILESGILNSVREMNAMDWAAEGIMMTLDIGYGHRKSTQATI